MNVSDASFNFEYMGDYISFFYLQSRIYSDNVFNYFRNLHALNRSRKDSLNKKENEITVLINICQLLKNLIALFD